jgi:hypothetical protein
MTSRAIRAQIPVALAFLGCVGVTLVPDLGEFDDRVSLILSIPPLRSG